ncbi:MAG: lysophospholipid acyltransferase family protein [Pseudomonadota bacterium]
MTGKGVMVANHSSWLDIFVLNAAAPVTFVSKSEVGSWPGIGWLAKATGTVFIDRDPRQAVTQNALFQDHLHKGTQLLFFPEGTSTDGLQVLAFKTTLFQSLVTSPERETLALQPMSVAYHAPKGKDPRFYGWWGDMPFGPHLLKILGADRHGSVDVQLHPPLTIGACANRKELAQASEARVRTGHASFTRDARPRGSADHSL